jgi:hypothetical protein
VRRFEQRAWLGSTIGLEAESGGRPELRALVDAAASAPYTVAIASDGELPATEPLVVTGSPFEVDWWQKRLERADARMGTDAAALHAAVERAEERALEAERERAVAASERLAAADALAEARARLLELERTVAIATVERHQLGEARAKLEFCEALIDEMSSSASWKLTRPLRALKRLAGRG